VTVCAYSGTPRGGFLAKNSSPSIPVGNRCSVMGRRPTIGMNQDPTRTKYSASSSFVMPVPGQSSRSGLEMRTSRAPSGPGTSTVVASFAAIRASVDRDLPENLDPVFTSYASRHVRRPG